MTETTVNGIALRDWFAGMAMAGHLSDATSMLLLKAKALRDGTTAERYTAEACYAMADAMMRQREPDQEPIE